MTDPYGHSDSVPEQPTKKPRRWPWIAGIILAFFVGGGAGMAGAADAEPEIVTEVETVTEEVEVEVEPADMDERRSALDERESQLDELDEELSAFETSLTEQEEDLEEAQASLEEREEAVSQEEETIAANSFSGSGTFIIGEEIEPGTYRTDGTTYCYWERLSGLSGEFHDIITNDFSEGTSYVTIAETDMAFSTQSCGEWTRQ